MGAYLIVTIIGLLICLGIVLKFGVSMAYDYSKENKVITKLLALVLFPITMFVPEKVMVEKKVLIPNIILLVVGFLLMGHKIGGICMLVLLCRLVWFGTFHRDKL